MSVDRKTARDEMLALIRPVLEGEVDVIIWDGAAAEPPRSSETDWARVSIIHAAGFQASLGSFEGKSRWRSTGNMYIQLFTTFGDGLAEDDRLSKLLLAALRGATTPGGVWMRNAVAREMGVDGGWHQSTVSSEFEYDEVA